MQKSMTYLDEKRVELVFEMPLAEVVFDFYDRLKSVSRGYASFDYQLLGLPRHAARRSWTSSSTARWWTRCRSLFSAETPTRPRRSVCERLRDEIPRQQFKIAIQGAIGGQIIARETVNAFRKDVTAKCYGGDITRKRKLLEKQKEGKKRMKMVGDVELPQSAFLAVLKTSEE